MAGRLDGRVALITGGASGLGEATVRLFAREGARVVIADLQDERGQRVAGELGAAALYQRTDVTREADIAAAVDRALAEFGRLDCMFNNAGVVGAVGPIDEIPVEDYDATMAINLRGVFLGMKHAARVMKPQRSGTILCSSSIAGVIGGLGPHVYATAKTALIGLTRNVAAELGAFGIRVNVIAPGWIDTPMTAGLPDEVRIGAGNEAVLGRVGEPQDVASVVLFLASEMSRHVTGQVLRVDGGQLIG